MHSGASTLAVAVEHGRLRKQGSVENAKQHKNFARRTNTQALAAFKIDVSRRHTAVATQRLHVRDASF